MLSTVLQDVLGIDYDKEKIDIYVDEDEDEDIIDDDDGVDYSDLENEIEEFLNDSCDSSSDDSSDEDDSLAQDIEVIELSNVPDVTLTEPEDNDDFVMPEEIERRKSLLGSSLHSPKRLSRSVKFNL